jgi:probable lipoprotein (TIGR04455 family)
MRRLALLVALLATASCASAIDSRFALRGYDARGSGAVKRIAVGAWAPHELTGVREVAVQVATDLVKLRKNYLVKRPAVLERDFAEACEGVEGVLAIRVLDLQVAGDAVTTRAETSLFRCADGALLWRTGGALEASSKDANLQNLAAAYVERAGEGARVYAAPLFALLQQLLAPLPDPVLTDAEIDEKIELGASGGGPGRLVALARESTVYRR